MERNFIYGILKRIKLLLKQPLDITLFHSDTQWRLIAI